MTHSIDEDDLHAYFDGALDEERRHQVEAWLADHPEQSERLRLWAAQLDGLHRLFDPVLDEPVPARLHPGAIRARRRAPRWAVQVAAGLLLFVLGGGAGWWLRDEVPPSRPLPVLAGEALNAHLVYASEIRHPVEVPASQQDHLVAWLSKRLGAPLRVPDLGKAGFALVGGRLLPAASGPAAQFMYENQAGQRLTLYVTHNPEGSATAFRFAAQDGLTAFYWLDGRQGYALVAALSREDLMPLTQTVHHQISE